MRESVSTSTKPSNNVLGAREKLHGHGGQFEKARRISVEVILDWSGGVLGILGAYLLAFDNSMSKYGWIAFSLANVFYIALARMIGRPGLLVQQLFFVGSSTLGVYNAFLAAPLGF